MKLFQKVKEIRSRKGDLHFERYAIVQTSFFGLYVHTIHKADQDPHLHSHPWNFLTIVLKGAYRAKGEKGISLKKPGVVSWMSRQGFHKIEEIVHGPVKTLFFTFGRRKPWYYLVGRNQIESNLYRKMKHTTGFRE